MSFVRTLIPVFLALWLPLSCHCRLQAIQATIADTTDWFVVTPHACGHDHHHDDGPQPDHDCDCHSHDQVLLRAAGLTLDSADPVAALLSPVPAMPCLSLPASPALARAGPPDPAQLKAGCTLLRLHCALTI
jgi:hypothetical protein